MAESVPQEAGKKRKRTGKQREEAKKAAIQAKLDAEAKAAEESKGEEPVDDVGNISEDQPEIDAKEAAPEKEGPDYEKIASRIPQALKTLHPTFKQSKTFEVRRLVKKIKFLRSKQGSKDELADLEAQLAMISHISLDPIIQSHLRIKLSKYHTLKSQPLPSSMSTLLTPKDTPSTSESSQIRAKVENRLCSSKIVADAIKTVIAWTVGEEGAKLVKKPSGRAETAKPKKQSKEVDGDSADDGSEEDETVQRDIVVGSDESDDEQLEEDQAVDEAGWESGSISGDDLPDQGSEYEVEEDEESDTSLVVPTKKAKPTKEKKESKTKPVTSSTFLPSLSHGFVMGDSDSDPDLDPDVDGAGIVGRKGAERKNRRGQRARQAIWEKKYGKNAKHVVKAREAEKTKEREKKFGPSDKGWGSKPRPEASNSSQNDAKADNAVRPKSFTSSQPAAQPEKPVPTPKAEGALHPSWEAARLRKQKAMGVGAPKPQKIVFD